MGDIQRAVLSAGAVNNAVVDGVLRRVGGDERVRKQRGGERGGAAAVGADFKGVGFGGGDADG